MPASDICARCGMFYINCICYRENKYSDGPFNSPYHEPYLHNPYKQYYKPLQIEEEKQMPNKSIKDLQVMLPWTTHYSSDFRATPMSHKDFGHALLHVHKAAGKLAAVVNDAEHGGSEFTKEEVDPYIADLVICALRMANVCPGRTIDLETAVIERLEAKNDIRIK
jgi:hypothetical protein